MAMAFVDKRETALKSPNMEPLGLRRALKDLSDSGNVISEVVTDAHTQVPPILSKHTSISSSKDNGIIVPRL